MHLAVVRIQFLSMIAPAQWLSRVKTVPKYIFMNISKKNLIFWPLLGVFTPPDAPNISSRTINFQFSAKSFPFLSPSVLNSFDFSQIPSSKIVEKLKLRKWKNISFIILNQRLTESDYWIREWWEEDVPKSSVKGTSHCGGVGLALIFWKMLWKSSSVELLDKSIKCP